jgi:uncharacterized membrane protein
LRTALAIAGFGLVVGLMSPAHAQFGPSKGGGGPGGQGPGGPGAPQAQGDQFQFKVCNRSRTPLFVAMLYKVGGNSWRTVGWADFKPGACGPVQGTYPRTDFYWYAEDGPGNVSYGGKDAYGCINSNDGFDRTITGEYQCAPNEKVVGFTKIDENSIRDGITLTD